MWSYRRILRISWVNKVTNEEVLGRMRKERKLLNTTKIRNLQYLGHVLRKNEYVLLKNMQGKMQERKAEEYPEKLVQISCLELQHQN